MKTNTYFEELSRITGEYEQKRKAHEEKKQAIIDTYGWDSKELEAWYHEKEEMKYPISDGACKAYRAFQMSERNNSSEFELEDFLWEREVEDFVDALKKAGITSFAYTNQSTAVMENLHQFAAAGCRMDGLCMVTRLEQRWGSEETTEHMGVRFTV